MPRKIKVVDLVTNDTTEIVDTNQPIEDKIFETEQSVQNIEEVEKTIETEPEAITITEEPKITTKVRTNELHECNKCGKFMTLKTLKYIHDNTCSGKHLPIPEKPTPKKAGRPKKQIVVEDIKTPQPIEKKEEECKPLTKPEVLIKSFEEMRKERLRERVQHRSQRISNLFLQAF